MQSSAQNKGSAIEKENIRSLSRLEVNNATIGKLTTRLNFGFCSISLFNILKTLLKSVVDSSVNEIGRRKIADRLGKRVLKRGKFMKKRLLHIVSICLCICGPFL